MKILKTLVCKRSVKLDGRRTSVSIENEFWDGLREIAGGQRLSISELVNQIARNRDNINLSSSIRLYVFNHFRALAQKAANNF